MKKILLLLIVLTPYLKVLGQNVTGKVTDKITQESLIGVNIITEKNLGTSTDMDGNYQFNLSTGEHTLTFKYIGYKVLTKTINLNNNQNIVLDITLETATQQLGTVVISAGKFEQKIEEITVSMEVIKPTLIENKNTTNIQTAIDQVPGVNITDGQANIRGGSGWSYGAGTRVLVMVDDMPLISGDAGQVQWSLIATENINQVEVIKGASSVLYGSSALNGVINIRTAFPSKKDIDKNPFMGYTKINTHFGLIDFPKKQEFIWWDKDKRRSFKGIEFSHAQKIKNLDLIIGGNWFNDDGYRLGETTQRSRFNFNSHYKSKGIKGLSFGINGNFLSQSSGTVLLWKSYEEAYEPPEGDLTTTKSTTNNVDPFIIYRRGNNTHSIRTRFLHVKNDNSTNNVDNNQDNKSSLFYADYKWQKNLQNLKLKITTGATNEAVVSTSPLFGGKNIRHNHAFYGQVDKKWNRLNVSAGMRYEHFLIHTDKLYYRIDDIGDMGDSLTTFNSGKPVFRTGINYQLAEATYIRSSWGQGYRFPSMAELFITASQSGLEIFPNPSLQPESGWSSEIGIKQGLKVRSWMGYIDLAAFIMQYDDMMEFTFAQYEAPEIDENGETTNLFGTGFKSINVGKTQISGVELSISGYGKINNELNVNILAGYTYIKPISLNPEHTYAYDYSNQGLTYINSSSDSTVLKYRYQHIAKFDAEINYKALSFGAGFRYNDFMRNIDLIFTSKLVNEGQAGIDALVPGINDSREQQKNGDLIIDVRLGYQLNTNLRFGFVVNNLLNREYMSRPADMRPPRTIAMQCSYKL